MPRRRTPAPPPVAPEDLAEAERFAPQEARPGPLPVGPFETPARATLERYAPALVGHFHDTINELRGAAERAKRNKHETLLAQIHDVSGRLTLRALELVLGRKMSVSVKLRTQDDLMDFRTLPPEAQAKLDAVLDEIEAIQKGRVLPAVALSSERVEP